MNAGVIVLAPPWPRSGSGNIFAAQTAAHAQRGARVLLLLVPMHRGHRRSPPIFLDTHDIQSEVFVAARRLNRHSGRVDSFDSLLKTDPALSSHADALIHLTQSDFEFFASRLPRKAHELVLPTLHPDSEAQLTRRRGSWREDAFGFAYVDTNHEANLETVRWLLREVLPLATPRIRERVRFVGKIDRLLSRHEPQLFKRHQHLFLGEVASNG